MSAKRRRPYFKAVIIIVMLLSVAGVISLAAYWWLADSSKETLSSNETLSLEPTVTVDQYQEIVSTRAQKSPRYSFLPRVPDSFAEKTAFYHIPGFMQGGDIICLRQKLPAAAIAKVVSDLEKSGRTEVRDFAGIPAPRCYPDFGLKKPSGDNLFEGVDELPTGFRIFLFESDLESIKKNWNHNFLAFTAVSLDAGEVVYYVDRW